MNHNIWILIKISLKFVPKVPINNIPALVQIMAWHRSGDKPLSEPMMDSLLTHICVTRPQWVTKTARTVFGSRRPHAYKYVFKLMISASYLMIKPCWKKVVFISISHWSLNYWQWHAWYNSDDINRLTATQRKLTIWHVDKNRLIFSWNTMWHKVIISWRVVGA